jgi:hypothetical protein
MGDKGNDLRREIEKGRQDIADTNTAMREKLAILNDRMQETVETVQETVNTVKHTFDLPYQVRQRPWLMVGGSLLVGYTLGRRGGSRADSPREPSGRGQHPSRVVPNQVQEELATIKTAAVGAVMSALWALAKQVLLPATRPTGVTTGPGVENGRVSKVH